MEHKSKTLENIIEECGEYFRALVKHTDYNKYKDNPMKWQAKVNQQKAKIPSSFGTCPEEAIWEMYLKLYSKRLIKGYKLWHE